MALKSDIEIPENSYLKLSFGEEHLIIRGTAYLSGNFSLYDTTKYDFTYEH